MSAMASERALQERVATLEQTITVLDRRAARVEQRLLSLESDGLERDSWAPGFELAPGSGFRTRDGVVGVSVPPPSVPDADSHADPAPAPPRAPARPSQSIADLVGGKWLAWLGGVATLLAIMLLLALAISHGWIGQQVRVALAAAGSIALLGAGIWLHGRRGRTEAAVTMAGVGIAGLFATQVVAAEVYQLIPPWLALICAALTGSVATMLAIRWAGRSLAALGLVGALLSPVSVGAPSNAATIAMLAVGVVSATCVVAWRRWGWLAIAVPLISAPQWASWMLRGHSELADVAVLIGFALVGLAGATATQLRANRDRLDPSAATLGVLNVCITATIGFVALSATSGRTAGVAWLALLAAAHAVPGMCGRGRFALGRPARRLFLVTAAILVDVGFALLSHGLVLTIGWGAVAVGLSGLVRRTGRHSADETLVALGLGVHISLVVLRTMLAAPPSLLSGSGVQLVPLMSCAVLAASCLCSAALTGSERRGWQIALGALGLAAVAYLTATALDGTALVVAWATEALALAQLRRRHDDPVAQIGAFAFLAVAAIHAIALEAPPRALVTGADSLVAASISLGAVVVAQIAIWTASPKDGEHRRWLAGGAALTTLYLASIAAITPFQPSGTSTFGTVLDLSVRQQGQVLLSTMWCLAGVALLVSGLRKEWTQLRNAGLALLLLTVAKVFVYDLSTLTSIYRVASLFVLGLLLLTGAFAYQRLRPPPPPDLRTLHPSQR